MRIELHAKQEDVLLSTAEEILFGGAAGGGKSFLLRALAILLCSNIPGLQVYLFRRTFPELFKNHMEGRTSFPAMLSEWVHDRLVVINWSDNKIKFWNGAVIHLCYCEHEKDVYKYQGAEIDVLLIDELTLMTKTIYTYLRGRVRSIALSFPNDRIRGWFKRVVCGTNPGNIGHNWVRAMFVDPRPSMEIWQTEDDDGGLTRQYIPARLMDNPTLLRDDPTYVKRLAGLGNPALVKAMLHGDWNIVAGGMFDDIWREDVHMIEPFRIPDTWRIDRSFDWGSSHPFAVSWWAQSNGEEVVTPVNTSAKLSITRRRICVPKGSVIKIAEWYGWNGNPNEGCKMLAKDIAKGIKERETMMRYKVHPGPADSSIFDKQNGMCIADDMKAEKIIWTLADKSPGSRKAGAQRIRTLLTEATKSHPEDPVLLFFKSCVHTARTIPVLPRDKNDQDDVDSDSEDHDYDTIRYRLQSKMSTVSVRKLVGH